MDKADFLYIAVIVNVVVMGYTIYKVYHREDYERFKRLTLLYITIIVPIFGLFLLLMDRQRDPE